MQKFQAWAKSWGGEWAELVGCPSDYRWHFGGMHDSTLFETKEEAEEAAKSIMDENMAEFKIKEVEIEE